MLSEIVNVVKSTEFIAFPAKKTRVESILLDFSTFHMVFFHIVSLTCAMQ